MLIVMPPLSSSQRGHAAIRRSSIDPIDIEMRIAAITVLQKQDEVDDKSHAPTYGTRGSPTGTSYTGRIVPHFPGEDFPQPLTALTTMETQSIYAVEDYSAGHGSHCGTTQASIYTLTAGAPPAREAHLMQLHAMRHYPLIDQYYFSQQECYLNKTLLKWEFDVLKLEESSAQGVLKDVGLKLFDIYGLVDEFELSLVALHQTFQLIQASYHNNPYHNAAHAADVVQAACCLVAEQKISKHMTKLEHLAMIIAGACHDLDHPGVNQAFLKTTNHYLTEAAKRYPSASAVHSDSENTSLDMEKKSSNDEQQSPLQQTKTTTNTAPVAATDESNVMSVLEIHHIRHAAAIFEQTRVFAHFSHEKYLQLLRLIKELILATDMAYQGRYMEKLKRLNKEYAALESEEEKDCFFRDEDTRRFYLQISLKCADICNTCRPWEVSQKWSRRVTEEFFNQGDMERNLELPINEINDRHRTTIEKVQVGFLKFVARPLFAEWDSIHTSDLSQSLLRYIDDNLVNWSKVQQQTEKLQSAKLSASNTTTTTVEQQRAHASSADTKSTSTVQQIPPSHQAATSTPPHLPPMQSTDSLYETRQFKPHPPDGMTELGVIGETPGDEQNPDGDDDEVLPPADLQQKTRRPSVPCAFVSLDLSVAIIKDNLRQQAAEDSRGADGAYDTRGLNLTSDKHDQAEMMVGKKKNQVTALVEALSERDSSTTAPGIEGQKPGDDSAVAVFASIPPQTSECNRDLQREGKDSNSRREALQHIDSSATIELPFGDRDDPYSGAPADELHGGQILENSNREATRSPTYSVYSQFKPRPNSEMLESMPSEGDSEQTQQHIQQYLTPTDYEADLLSRLKYQPFNPEIVAEIQQLSPYQRGRIDELTRQEKSAKSSSKPQLQQQQQPLKVETSSMKVHRSSNVVASDSEKTTTTGSKPEATAESKDLNSYAKLTSPPPYRKSIMLTVDKGLEKLRSDHAAKTSASGSGKKFGLRAAKQSLTPQGATQECVKATQATVYEPATLTSQKQTRTLPATIPFLSSSKVPTPQHATAPALSTGVAPDDAGGGSGGARPPRRTTSARSENLLPSSIDYSPILSSESLTPGYSSTSSMTSPEMPRRKINQSRSKFFQSLLPASLHHLKASSPEHLNHHHRRLQPDHQQPHHPRHHSSSNVTAASETPSPRSPGVYGQEGESTTVYSSSSFLTTSTIPHSSPNASCSSTSGIEGDSGHRLRDEDTTSGDVTGSSSKSRKALDQELQALSASVTASPEESSESPCNITAGGVHTSSGQTYNIHIDNEDTAAVEGPNQGRRPSRTLVQDPVASRTAKRSQSASARLAKTFQKFFGGGAASKPAGGRSPREKAPERSKAPPAAGSTRENTVGDGTIEASGSTNMLSTSTSVSGSRGTTSPSSAVTAPTDQSATSSSSTQQSSRSTAPISEDNEHTNHPPNTASNKKT
ncbi:uncharacterized protein LOC142353511 isoform X3 [Convolutriloba macropyga]|uniref:uncharacterized protein LOC142353511 isoform X3 n=1 Tax=Convolutriloba macropyga TaxID=536237 RepID=UPI003F521E49